MVFAVNLAVEDQLTEDIIRRLCNESAHEYFINVVYGRGGYGQIQQNIRRYNEAAKHFPFLVVTDLDRNQCPSALVTTWLPVPRSQKLLFRVAVKEVESWVLGDKTGFASLLGVSENRIPGDPESLADAKQRLLQLASRARTRMIREGVVRRNRNGAYLQGPDYNGILGSFVLNQWNPRSAETRCASLLKMRARLDGFPAVADGISNAIPRLPPQGELRE